MRRWSKVGLGFLLVLVILGCTLGLGLYRADPVVPRPSSTAVYDRHGDLLRIYTSEDQGGMLRLAVRFDELPEHLVAGLTSFEDRRFLNTLASTRLRSFERSFRMLERVEWSRGIDNYDASGKNA